MTRRRNGLVLVGAALVAALAVPAATVHAAPAGAPPGRAVAPVEGQPACGTELPASAARRHAADHAASPVRVATYNFLHARGTSNASLDARIPLLVDAIARARADILGVQEVEELGSRGFTTARVSRGLANATGRAWHWCFFAANPVLPDEPDSLVGGGGPQSVAIQRIASGSLGETVFRTGIGVLSRYPIVDSGAHRLGLREEAEIDACPDLECLLTAMFESRAAIRVLVETPRGRVHVVSTHLAHSLTSLSDLTRVAQNRRMLDWIDAFSAAQPYPVALTGDFNAREGSAVHAAVIGAGFVDTFRAVHRTADGFTSSQDIDAPAPTVRSRIDYVFVRGSACTDRVHARATTPKVLSSRVFGDSPTVVDGSPLWPSDHYGVVSTLLPVRAVPGSCAAAVGKR